jgi:uncharacterized damage-inducible protein DinB
MNVETLKQLYAYNRWANEQVWRCVAALPEAEYMAEHDYSIGSLFNQVFHMMQTDWWSAGTMNRNLPAQDDPAYVKQEDYTDRAALWKKWQTVLDEIDAHLDTLTDATLQKMVNMPVPDGYDPKRVPLWETHMVGINHGTNHRAQVLALLYQRGGKTVEQGYYFFVLERATETV